jgi:hypothetical protein
MILRICSKMHQDPAWRLLEKETFGEEDLNVIAASVKENFSEGNAQ